MVSLLQTDEMGMNPLLPALQHHSPFQWLFALFFRNRAVWEYQKPISLPPSWIYYLIPIVKKITKSGKKIFISQNAWNYALSAFGGLFALRHSQ
jgi:hypothetical protein